MTIRILVVTTLVAAAAEGVFAAPPAPTPAAPDCQLLFASDGTFSRDPVWRVNLVNAPITAARQRPADRSVAPEVLAALNAAAPDAIARAATARTPHACRDLEDGKPPRARAAGAPPRESLHVSIGGNDELGGLVGGTTLRVTLATLGREPEDAELVGHAARAVEDLATPAAAVAALDRALAAAIAEASENLARARKDDASAVPAFVTLVIHFDALSAPEIAAAKALAPCIAGLAGARVRPPRRAHELNSETIDLRFQTHPELEQADSATSALEAIASTLASTIRREIGSHGKLRCSFFGTPLAGRTFQVGTDAANGSVWLRFDRRSP